jgi:hypothetical protein
VAALDPSPAASATTDLDLEAPHHGAAHNVFLKLRFGLLVDYRTAAAETALGQGNRKLFVDPLGNRSRSALAVLGPGLAARPLGMGLGFTLGERRGLPLERSQRFF